MVESGFGGCNFAQERLLWFNVISSPRFYHIVAAMERERAWWNQVLGDVISHRRACCGSTLFPALVSTTSSLRWSVGERGGIGFCRIKFGAGAFVVVQHSQPSASTPHRCCGGICRYSRLYR